MNEKKPQLYFLLAILAGTFVLAFFIFRPFLYAFILAAVFAVVFQPIYQKILNLIHGRQGLAALLTILIVVIFIFVPVAFLGIQIFKEAEQLYFSLMGGGGKDAVFSTLNSLIDNLKNYFPSAPEFSAAIDTYLKQLLGWLIDNLGAIFSGLAKLALSSFLFLVSLYYLLKDGEKFKKAVIALSPLSDENDEIISQKLEVAIGSVMKGSLLIAVVQGVVTSAGFVIFGIPNAIFWGSVAAIAALIPGIGTALVVVPAILFLFINGEISAGIGFTIWGVGVVGLVDNFLAPKLLGRGMHVHPLIILLSVLGGIGFFGPIGFLLGPLTISLLFVLLDIYSSLTAKEKR
ncbi:MAG: AI-2E family transporter [Candidatus Liptonbacteria bacterium]|nr:AI-2E family transporter [Candidatus Liptonbacteria bacterium]